MNAIATPASSCRISGETGNGAVREHKELIRLCRAGMYHEAAQLMREHIDHIRIGLVDLFQSRRKDVENAAGGVSPS